MGNITHKNTSTAGRTAASIQPYAKDSADDNILRFLDAQLAGILSRIPMRPWYYWEAHNPWGMSAPVIDSWGFLDICQDDRMTGLAAPFIGDDVILYDSQFHPDPTTRRHTDRDGWQCDAAICPVSPRSGVVVRIVVSDEKDRTTTLRLNNPELNDGITEITLTRGTIIAHDIHSRYRYAGDTDVRFPLEYLIRYFPATSTYIRQQHSDYHRQMNIDYPLQNYAAKPLWLVRGEDRAGNDFVTGFKARAGQWVTGEQDRKIGDEH